MITSSKLVSGWLLLCCLMVLSMVWIGGFTRLTSSGLSITEWKIASGIIPPLTHSDWLSEFKKYKATPEYIYINNDISIAKFKKIYLTEYAHRLLGRLTVLFFIIPLLYFLITKKLTKSLIFKIVLVCCIGLLQGVIGWYMVKSGLVNQPEVSHYMLTLHLLIALVIFQLLWVEFLKLNTKPIVEIKSKSIHIICLLLPLTIFTQITLGGLVAGLKAGLIFNTFPLMDGQIIPYKLFSVKPILSDPTAVQFLHRLFGFLTLFHSLLASVAIFKMMKKASITLALMSLNQFTLGIFTLVSGVKIHYASLHQIFAFLLFATASYVHYVISSQKNIT